jgi:dipeptidyl aminopeptidase/acylaminoacyl peptidase
MVWFVLLAGVASPAPGAVDRRLANDGQVVLEDVPALDPQLAERLGRYQQLRAAQMLDWTADGKSLYVRARYRGVAQIQRISRRDAEPEPLTRGLEPVREVVRQPGGELLAFTRNTGGSADDQLFLLDPATGTERALTRAPDSLNNRMAWSRDGARLAFRSNRRNGASNDLWILPIDQPETARLVLEVEPGSLWKPVAFSPDDRLLLVQQYRGITDSRIHVLDLETGALRQLVGLPDAESSNVAVGFDGAGEGVFFVSNLRGGAAEIGWAPLDPARAIRWVDTDIPWDITSFELSADGSRGAFVTNEHGVSRLYLFNPSRFSTRPVSDLPLGVISGLRFSADGHRLGFSLSTPTSPGDVYVLRTSGFGSFASWPRPWTRGSVTGIDRRELVTPALFSFPAAGIRPDTTLNVPGFAYRPRGKGPHPVVIYIHGGPESQYRPAFNSTVQIWAAELGVAVLAPNVRGSLGYGRGYLGLDDGKRREDAVADIGALLDWIATRPELDETRVAVYGASYGGYMVLASAVHYSDRLVAGVNRAGISNFVTYLENTGDFRRDLRRFEYGDERDPDMRAFLESISPLNHVDRIDIPLFIAQGQNDPVVPASESAQMVEALRARGQTVWTMNALNEGHGYDKQPNRDLYQQVTFRFFEEFLLGR